MKCAECNNNSCEVRGQVADCYCWSNDNFTEHLGYDSEGGLIYRWDSTGLLKRYYWAENGDSLGSEILREMR